MIEQLTTIRFHGRLASQVLRPPHHGKTVSKIWHCCEDRVLFEDSEQMERLCQPCQGNFGSSGGRLCLSLHRQSDCGGSKAVSLHKDTQDDFLQ